MAGWGTRRLPITKVIEKAMLPIGNRPLVDYVVEDCAKAGIEEAYIVIDEKPFSQIKAYYEENAKLNNITNAEFICADFDSKIVHICLLQQLLIF